MAFCAAPASEAAGPDCLSISQIQGPGSASRYDGRKGLACVQGCVTGVAADGFYIQSVRPDADPATSEGIFVYRYNGWDNPRRLKPGDLVEIRNFGVQEFYGSTEIVKLKSDRESAYRRLGACTLPEPAGIEPLTDPATDPEAVYERVENMRVKLALDGIVVGPTTRYVSRFPAGDPEIAVLDARSPWVGMRPFAGDLLPGRGMIYLSGGLNRDLPAVRTGDRVASPALTGVLAYQFGRFVLLTDGDAAAIAVTAAPDVEADLAAIGPDEFAVCTFNVKNLFDETDDGDGDVGDWSPADGEEYALWLEKRAHAIRENLRGCTVVALQEVEGKDAVWSDLANAAGSYRFDYYESADERDITVGILYDPERVTLKHSAPAQACTPRDFGVDYHASVGPRALRNPCAQGSYPLFDRPPYTADLAVRNAAGDRKLHLRLVVNHFKSRRGDETINRDQRLAQARYVAGLLDTPQSMAVGDLNDTPDSPTLRALGAFTDLYDTHLSSAEAYTYIYNGLAETPDYAIVARGLLPYVKAIAPVHINADFPDLQIPDRTGRRSSDHDPLFVRFTLEPGGYRPDWRQLYLR